MSLKKIFGLLFENDDPDIPIKIQPITQENQKPKYNYPISEHDALNIANKYLTKVYMKDWNEGIPTYVSLFFDIDNVITKNNRKYYHIKCTGGDLSGIDGDTFWDGEVSKEEAKKLQCLIDVNTGKYIYMKDEHIE